MFQSKDLYFPVGLWKRQFSWGWLMSLIGGNLRYCKMNLMQFKQFNLDEGHDASETSRLK